MLAGGGRDALTTAGEAPALQIACHSKAVVSVLKFGGDAGAGGAAGDFDVVTPGTSAGGLAWWLQWALVWAFGIPLWRDRIVVWIVPIVAPFVDVVADVVETKVVWPILGNYLWSVFPAGRIIRQSLRWLVSPGELLLFQAAACSTFPLGFGRKTEMPAGLRAQPFAVVTRFVPGDRCDWLARVIEVWIVPERRRRCRCRAEIMAIIFVRDLRGRETEGVDPDSVDWAFAVLTLVGSHQEPGCRDANQVWFDPGAPFRSLRDDGARVHIVCRAAT